MRKKEQMLTLQGGRKWQLFYSFLFPVFIMLIAFAAKDISPFGDRNLMAMDGYAQYYPMLRQYLRAGSDFSFAGGLGFNRLTQSAYYTNSPLWLLLRLFPVKYSIQAVHFIVILRFGLAGLSFAYFLLRRYQVQTRYLFAFASAYALSAYNLAFINQFMWMDIVILLPLLAAALLSLWEDGHFLPYALLLALALYSNFYLAYSLCLFAVLWSFYLLFKEKEKAKKRLLFLLRFAASSLLGAGLSAFVLLPAYLGLQNTLAAGLEPTGSLKMYHPLWQYFQQLLPFQKISLVFEVPNLYAGLLTFLLALCYLFNKKRTWRDRVIFILFLLFSYLSFNLNALDYIWHGFHYPNQLPGRQSYLFIFVLLLFAFTAYKENSLQISGLENEAGKRKNYRGLKTLIAVLLLIELSSNAIFTVSQETWAANHPTYIRYEEEMLYLTEKYAPGEDEFFRTEFLKPHHNQGLRYGYNGLGYYSSLMSGKSYEFFVDIGMEVYAKNVSTNFVPDRLVDNIFAVRYLIQKNSDPVDFEDLHLVKVEELKELTLYENPDYFSLGFVIDGLDSRGLTASEMREELGKHLGPAAISQKVQFMTLDSIKPDRIQGHLTLEEEGQLLTSIGSEEGWSVYVNGEKLTPFEAYDYLLAIPLPAGQHHLEFIYRTPGKAAGTLLTLLSAASLLLWYGLENKRQKSVRE